MGYDVRSFCTTCGYVQNCACPKTFVRAVSDLGETFLTRGTESLSTYPKPTMLAMQYANREKDIIWPTAGDMSNILSYTANEDGSKGWPEAHNPVTGFKTLDDYHNSLPRSVAAERFSPSNKEARELSKKTPNDKGFKKFDDGKAQWHLMPEEALAHVLKVLEDGAKTYGDFNWLDNAHEVDLVRYMNALERHFKSFKTGNDFDEKSKNYEMAHIACNALFILTMQIKKLGMDTRRKK